MKKFIANIDVSLLLSVVSLVLLFVFAANVHAAQEAKSEARINRYVVAVSANDGGNNRPMLRYAESDAKSFANVLREMGGVPAQNVLMTHEPSIAKFMESLNNLDKIILEGKSKGGRDEVLVYYSGHADDKGLRLGNEIYAWKDLRSRIDRLQADVKIAVIDACGSGAITRAKGGVAVPAFMVDESSDMKGYAFITSSTQDESSQESDKLKGSFFTHSLVSGLRGAGDLSGDGKVTLSEAYQFAFNETLQKTESTMGGAQHPSRDMNLAGTGDVVMTDLRSTGAGMDIADNVGGRLYIHDEKGELVAELNKKTGRLMSLGLPAGKYTVNLQHNAEYGVATIALANGKRAKIKNNDFQVVSAEQTVLRGEIAGHSSCADGDTAKCSLDSLDHNGKSHATFNFVDIDKEPRKGVQVGLLVTDAQKEFIGSQVSLFANVTGKNSVGMQITTGANVANNMDGVQISATANVARKIDGLQLTSGVNVARHVEGFQVGSGLNVAEYSPVQIGVLNIVDTSNVQVGVLNIGDTSNVQVGVLNIGDTANVQVGVMNVADSNEVAVSVLNIDDQTKAQVGVLNIADTVHTIQVGVLNICAHAEGLVVGLLSFVGNGVLSLMGSIDEMGMTSLMAKFGTAYFYTGFEMGRVLKTDNLFEYQNVYTNALVVGTQFGRYGTHLDLDYSWISTGKTIARSFGYKSEDEQTYFHRIRLSGTYKLITGIGITGGISLNLETEGNASKLWHQPRGKWHDDVSVNGHKGRFWPGFYAGLTIGRF